MILMTRRVAFSAAQADWLPELSDAENSALFGPDASPEPYGHNYVLDIGVSGKIDPHTGVIVNIKEIDRIVKERVVQYLDRKFINRRIAAFHDRPVTLENLTRYIAGELEPHLPPAVQLKRVKLEATPTRWSEWNAAVDRPIRRSDAMYLTRQYEFSASHRLHSPHLSPEENRQLFGKCNYENGHGHNYELEVTVTGPIDARSGRVCDPDQLDLIVHREVVDRYDHRHLNQDIPEFADQIPSAEMITVVIWERLRSHIPSPARLYRVLLRETPRNFFEYYGEDEKVQ